MTEIDPSNPPITNWFLGELASHLNKAAQLIDVQLAKDEHFPELYNLLELHRASGDYAPEVKPKFVKKKVVTFPTALIEQFESKINFAEIAYHLDVQRKCLMGIFPDIQRAWLSLDNQFFLWNYENG